MKEVKIPIWLDEGRAKGQLISKANFHMNQKRTKLFFDFCPKANQKINVPILLNTP